MTLSHARHDTALPSAMTLLYLLFLFVTATDLLLTLNGLRAGFLREVNPFLAGAALLWHTNIVIVMVISKVLAASLAFWLAFGLPARYGCPGRIFSRPACLPPAERMPATILLVLAAATALLGVLPAVAGHVRHYIAE